MGEEVETAPAAPVDNGEGDSTSDSARVAELGREAASYRTQRNDALRRAHALDTIVRAHNIAVDDVMTPEALDRLPINAGQVDGPFRYVPPKFTAPVAAGGSSAAPASSEVTLSRETIESMTPEQINARWDDIKAFLRKG